MASLIRQEHQMMNLVQVHCIDSSNECKQEANLPSRRPIEGVKHHVETIADTMVSLSKAESEDKKVLAAPFPRFMPFCDTKILPFCLFCR
mmetsp:Transcript_25355/g.52772  ORF Transcript_25355/g.52772 Transcript_25355/m.52772 type:complete len:90 (+) Transcript_25355:994-1263(+)